MQRTKIVCTIGPACEAPEMLERLVEAGTDVARLNFSQATHEWHARIAASPSDRDPPDLAGIKVRIISSRS